MSRKLAKKLHNTIQHEEDESNDGVAGNNRGGVYGQTQNSRRGNPPPHQQSYDAEDDLEDEPSNPLQRERPYAGYDPSNPFTHYDNNRPQNPGNGGQRGGSSLERIQNQERVPPRLAASILRQPSPMAQKDPPPDRWAAPPQEEDGDDEEYEAEEDGDEDGEEVEEPITVPPRRIPLGRGSSHRLGRNDKDQVSAPKKSGSSSSGGQKGQPGAKKPSNHAVRKSSSGSNKGKDLSSQQQNPSGSEGRRSRNGSVSSINNGNGSYGSSSSGARLGRSGSSRDSKNKHKLKPLEIEIPEDVADEAAFRNYLSVRRGAVGPTTHAPFPRWEEPQSDSQFPAGGGSRHGSSKTKHLNRPGGLEEAAAATASLLIQRKSMALSHAIMTLALLSASASQLRFVVAYSNAHSYPALNYFLICSCILVEILVGIGYLIISRFEFSERTLDKTNTYLIFGLFFVAIANVIISSFALDDHVCEVLAVLAKQRDEQFDTIDNSQTSLNVRQSPNTN